MEGAHGFSCIWLCINVRENDEIENEHLSYSVGLVNEHKLSVGMLAGLKGYLYLLMNIQRPI